MSPPMTGAQPRLRVHLLGRFHVTLDQRPIEPQAWRLRSAAALVKLLALAPDLCLHREQLMDLLWPEVRPDAATNNLRQSLHSARRILDVPAKAAPFLQRRGDMLVLAPAELVWTDVHAFEEAIADAWRGTDPILGQHAVALYAGDLLPDDLYEDWAADRRTALRVSYLAVLTRLAELHEERGELGLAIQALERLLASEPLQDSAHAALMRLYAHNGQRPLALAQYDLLQSILERELDAEPEPAARDLMLAIRDGNLSLPRGSHPTRDEPARQPTTPSLPAALNELLGRAREIGEVRQLLATTRLLTLTGAGGIGKTRLAMAVAQELKHGYPDGAVFVSLATVQDPEFVVSAIAQRLQVREFGGQPLQELVKAQLRDKQLLLVLDNLEHLLAAGPILTDLLAACPRVTMLVTSRARLKLTGEREYLVPPLAYPDSTRLLAPAAFLRYPAIALFVQRVRDVRPGFEIMTENATTIAAICRNLDGLPLAIELAAARGKVLPLDALLDRLTHPMTILADGPRDAPERQQSMRNSIRWSYDLLDRDEAWLLHRLSVFAGGWTLETAEAVIWHDDRFGTSVLDGLTSLVDKSLVHQLDQAGSSPRFNMLEPVREFGLEQLDAGEDGAEARERHARCFVLEAEPTAAQLEEPEPGAWLDRLETEHDNFRAALQWCIASGTTELGQRLAGALWEFWNVRGHLSEGRRWLDLVLQAEDGDETAARAEALRGAGELARRQGDFDVTARRLDESLALYQRLGKEHGYARALNGLGILAAMRGDLTQAQCSFEEVLEISERLSDMNCAAHGLLNLGNTLALQGDFQQARRLMEEAVALQRSVGNRIGVAFALTNLSIRAYDDGDYEHARGWTEESLSLFQELGDQQRASHLMGNLGEWAHIEGDYALAGQRFEESLLLSRKLGDRPQVASRLRLLGEVALASGEPYRAARLFGAAEVMRESVSWNAISRGSRERYVQAHAALRATLDEAELTAAWDEGRRMSMDNAIDFAVTGDIPALRTLSEAS